MNSLSEARVRSAKGIQKPQKLFDGGGLYLLVQPTGARLWRLKYRHQGREKLLSFGAYPEVSLRQAREYRDEARRKLASDIDPSALRKAEKLARADTFEAVALEWLELQRPKLADTSYRKSHWMLTELLFPYLGSKPIASIQAPDLLDSLRVIERRRRHETAHRAKQKAGQVFRYAIATGRASRDPSADLRGALAPVVTRNRAAVTDPVRAGQLLRALDGYDGQATTAAALQLAPLLFVRPGELRHASWEEFALDDKTPEWRIPAERMKMGELHIVPLAHQAVAILRRLHEVTGPDGLLFPSLRTSTRPMSENTINAALRRLGYSKDEMTAHGFRAMASTILNELGVPPDVIELQLAHQERNKVRAAYNRAQRLAERRKLMQDWADHLDKLRAQKPRLARP